jgi:hypothetical protein
VQALKDRIAGGAGILLSRAPWDLDATDLGEDAPACNACPQNTSANLPLFGDLAIGEPTCTDGACFREKTHAFVRIQARVGDGHADASGPAMLRVSWKEISTAPRLDKESAAPVETQTFKARQWVEAKKKSCAQVRTAVTVDWSDANARGYMGSGDKLRKPGEILQVCVAAGCKPHPKAWENAAAAQAAQGAKREGHAESAAREAAERDAFEGTEPPVRRALYDAILAKLTPVALKRMLLADAGTYDVAVALGLDQKGDWGKAVRDRIAAAKDAELDGLLFAACAGGALDVDPYDVHRRDLGRDRLRTLAKFVGVDALAVEKRAEGAEKEPAKKKDKAKAKPAAAEAVEARKPTLSAAARKRVIEAQKKRLAAAAKKPAKKVVKKGGAK